MKYRKKPVVIEAIKWTGYSKCLKTLLPIENAIEPSEITEDRKLIIHTLEGNMTAEINDWIIKGVKGELYPCKPDIFEQTYEPVGVD